LDTSESLSKTQSTAVGYSGSVPSGLMGDEVLNAEWIKVDVLTVTHTASFFSSLSFSLLHNRWVSPQPRSIIM